MPTIELIAEIQHLRTQLAECQGRLGELDKILNRILSKTRKIDVGVWQVVWGGNLLDDIMNVLTPTIPSVMVTVRREDAMPPDLAGRATEENT